MNSLTIPSLTLEQLKKTSKNLKQALSDLGTDITHSTALNLTSRGVGFKDYNTAKAFLGKNEVVFDVGQTSPQPSQYAYTTMLYDLKSKDLFGVHLPIIKGFAMGIEADGAIGKDEAKALGIELAVNLDWQAPKPIERNISMIYDNAGGFLLVNVDEYDGLDQFFELVFTYRKFGVKRLALVSRDRIPQSLYDACVKNKVHFAQSTSPLGVFVELRHKNKPSAEAGVTHVPKAEFKELVSRCGLGEADAEKLTLSLIHI